MIKQTFINNVINEITEGRSIPISPKIERIDSIIKTALMYFRENADEASSFEYIIVKNDVINTPLFKEKRQIQLPKCVEAIEMVQETGTLLNLNGNINPDYRKTNFNYHLAIAGDSDTMLYGVVASSYNDFMRNFIVRSVAYDYNPHSNMLVIKGRQTFVDLILHAYVHLSDESMFESERFFRYVCGKCRISIANILGLVSTKLISNSELNIEAIREQGNNEIEEVKEEIKDDRNTVDYWVEF